MQSPINLIVTYEVANFATREASKQAATLEIEASKRAAPLDLGSPKSPIHSFIHSDTEREKE